ncbi:GspH/FimT family pseudopilin [Rheinheimera sp. FR7-31]|uniref:GspH/FimT family pseudopilin n=1 Tax=Rheinheimera fenheensis TaxID=3152295 RepID=UPI00325D3399
MTFPARTGFSLPELLISLAILIMFTTMAVPALASFIDRQRAAAYIRQFSQHLAYARVAASSSNLPVQFCPMQDGVCTKAWHSAPVQLFVQYPSDGSSKLLRELPAVPQGHQLVYNREAISFRRDDSLNGFENGTFYYCAKPTQQWYYRLTVNQAGRGRLTEVSQACPY